MKAVIFHKGTGTVILQPAGTAVFNCWVKGVQILYDFANHYKLFGEKNPYIKVWRLGNILNINPTLKTRCIFSVSEISIVNNF